MIFKHRLLFTTTPFFIIFIFAGCAFLFSQQEIPSYISWKSKVYTSSGAHGDYTLNTDPSTHGNDIKWPPFFALDHKTTHLEIRSKITPDGSWFPIEFSNRASYNPSIIPHPDKNDTWFIVAQRDKSKDDDTIWFAELVCEAQFRDAKLQCIESPLLLPIASTVSQHCDGDLDFFNLTMGPHDARVFQGPDQPFIIYGSQSQYNCFGLWIHDFRRLVDWSRSPDTAGRFFWPTDLPRPRGQPHLRLEKNWFPFWDNKGEMHFHYTIAPDLHSHGSPLRSFAKVQFGGEEGLVGKDLAPLAAESDAACVHKYAPWAYNHGLHLESVHQATNSLAITLCNRADPQCHKSDDNTFIFTIFQFKSFYSHGVFEPYVMLFEQTAPFRIHGISPKPFWYHGRGEAGGAWVHVGSKEWIPKNSTQMVYTTSMNWKQQGLTYNGYLDDVLLIGLGVEDQRSFGIDVVAGDLIAGLGFCN